MKKLAGIFPELIAVMMVFGVTAFAEGVFAQEKGGQSQKGQHEQLTYMRLKNIVPPTTEQAQAAQQKK